MIDDRRVATGGNDARIVFNIFDYRSSFCLSDDWGGGVNIKLQQSFNDSCVFKSIDCFFSHSKTLRSRRGIKSDCPAALTDKCRPSLVVRTRVFSSEVRDSGGGSIGIVEFVSLKDESETGHGGGADDRDGGSHGEAVGLGGRRGRTAAGGSSARTSGLSGSGCDGLGAGLVRVCACVCGNALTSGVCGEGVAALETNVGGSGELHDGVGRGSADVSGAADGVAVCLDSNVGGGLYNGSVNGDKGSRNSNVRGGLDVGDNNAGGISRGGGDCASGAGAAAAVGLVVAAVRVAVCEDGGGKAEDEAVLDLHIECWRLVLGGG
jgi:hypothetical protein